MTISRRVQQIGLSPTLRINALAGELRASGVDVLDFSAGQPDFPTPENVKRAGVQAIEANQTRYTPNSGMPDLRRAIADHIRRETDVDYPAEQILVSPGAKASLYFACMTLLDPDDEVLIPLPYWVSYPEQVRLAGAKPVFVPCDEASGFKLTVDRLAAAATERSRALILNYPSNPTGACYDRDELEPLARFCAERDIWILADEIYSRLLYDGRRFTSVAALGESVRGRSVMINGMSKTWAMTGWRVGYAAGPREVIDGMARLQSHSTSNVTSISQWASLEALTAPQDEIDRRVEEFQRRRDEMLARLAAIPGLRCGKPEGSFYLFPNVSGCFDGPDKEGGIRCGEDVARLLLEEARVAVVPGEAFGSPDHVRISYAASMERIREGMERITAALAATR